MRLHGSQSYEPAFEGLHARLAESSRTTLEATLLTRTLPLVPGLVERLDGGTDVADVGCGRGAPTLPPAPVAGRHREEQHVATRALDERAHGRVLPAVDQVPAGFDCKAQPSMRPKVVRELATMRFVGSPTPTTARRAYSRALRRDRDAVPAGLCFRWGDGRAEGHVHRIRLAKPTMYGRAAVPLPRARVSHAA